MTLLMPDAPTVFERGDRIFFTAPVQGFAPTDQQIEEYAFSSQIKKQAPNDNLLWLKGQYVEADQPNANGTQWRADDLALKSLTPMLMPVTVMHDPRTAVGTIADVALRTPEKDQVQRARLDTILAIWEHRFPEVAAEVKANLDLGQLMQSMECFSPWYECSACSMVFHKLPHGAERSQWCDHLKASEGVSFVAGQHSDHQTQAWRILGDVCFTGVGLIYGTRGAKGALSTANLEAFQEEVAEYHQQVHTDTARTARSHRMGLVQIDEQELATLRTERNEALDKVRDAEAAKADAEKKAEEAEAAQKKAEDDKAAADKERDELKEQNERAQLKDKRVGELGEGFTAKLGDFTRGRLNEQAGTLSDEEWDSRLKELEETAGVKRDAKKDGSESAGSGSGDNNGGSGKDSGFGSEEVAAFVGKAGGNGQPSGSDAPNPAEVRSTVGSLARSMRPKRETASSNKS